jgi:hypothetical protein
MIATVVLWAFVLNLGTAFGAGIYEHRAVLPRWFVTSRGGEEAWDAERARSADPGRRFWVWATTLPLTLLTLTSGVLAWQAGGVAGSWWLTSAGLALAERALTFGYFIPVMVRLLGPAVPADAARIARRWMALNYLRHALVLAAWMAALRAFALRFPPG